jgi:hypothetical protein
MRSGGAFLNSLVQNFDLESYQIAIGPIDFSEPQFAAIAQLNQAVIATFLRVSQPLISRDKVNRECLNHPPEILDGRPSLISLAGKEKLLQWLRDKWTPTSWPTARELKEQIVLALEAENITPLLRSWWPKFIAPLIRKEFRIHTVQPLEQDCYQLTPDDTAEHFRQLSSLPTSDSD